MVNHKRLRKTSWTFYPCPFSYWKDIADKFGVTPEWASECVSSIIAAKRMSRDAFMYRLSLLGWTQSEIGKLFELTQGRVAQNISKLKEFNSLITSDFKHPDPFLVRSYFIVPKGQLINFKHLYLFRA